MKICFLIGSVAISGGAYVVFQHASYLSEAGYEVVVAAQDPFDGQTHSWHPLACRLRIIPFELAERETFDLVIATWWKTALTLHRFNSRQYAYFVQSIESRFYSETEMPLRNLVDSTYNLPLSFVTEAKWIRDYLHKHHDKNAELVPNGIRKDLYTPVGSAISKRKSNGHLRVLVEGPFGVFFKNTGRTVNVVKRANPDEIWLLTSSDVAWLPGVDRVFSGLPIFKVPEVYRSCDVIVKLSYVEGMFGPPLEMYHCGGTSITYDVTGYDEYIKHDVNGLVASKDDESKVVDYIHRLKSQPELLSRLRRGAEETASEWPDWDHSSALFLSWAERIMSLPASNQHASLKEMVESTWEVYCSSETMRIRKSPLITIRYRMDAALDRLPSEVTRKLRWLRYISECYR